MSVISVIILTNLKQESSALKTRRTSAFNDFDVKDFNISVMYNDLVLLMERSGLSKKDIELVEVPTFGWSPVGKNTGFNAKNGMIQLYRVVLTQDPYFEDS